MNERIRTDQISCDEASLTTSAASKAGASERRISVAIAAAEAAGAGGREIIAQIVLG